MIIFAKAALRRFVIGCVAVVVAVVVSNSLHRTTFTAPSAPSVAKCEELIASGRVDTCRVIDPFDDAPERAR